MARDRYDDECPGCRPAMVDVKTGRPLANDSVEMTVVNRLWGEMTPEDRRAWHRFTCQNSRVPGDTRVASAFADRVGDAFSAAAATKKGQ